MIKHRSDIDFHAEGNEDDVMVLFDDIIKHILSCKPEKCVVR